MAVNRSVSCIFYAGMNAGRGDFLFLSFFFPSEFKTKKNGVDTPLSNLRIN